jgi:hypothetical protein
MDPIRSWEVLPVAATDAASARHTRPTPRASLPPAAAVRLTVEAVEAVEAEVEVVAEVEVAIAVAADHLGGSVIGSRSLSASAYVRHWLTLKPGDEGHSPRPTWEGCCAEAETEVKGNRAQGSFRIQGRRRFGSYASGNAW